MNMEETLELVNAVLNHAAQTKQRVLSIGHFAAPQYGARASAAVVFEDGPQNLKLEYDTNAGPNYQWEVVNSFSDQSKGEYDHTAKGCESFRDKVSRLLEDMDAQDYTNWEDAEADMVQELSVDEVDEYFADGGLDGIVEKWFAKGQ